MRNFLLILIILALLPSDLSAFRIGAVVDEYEDLGWAEAKDVVVHPNGDIFVVGVGGINGPDGSKWIVRKSSDQGSHWKTVDDSSGTWKWAEAISAFVGSNGDIFVTGAHEVNNTQGLWTLRRSQDGGRNWTTLDSHLFADFSFGYPVSIAQDSKGNLFVAGFVFAGMDSETTWVVRKSSDDGLTWKTVMEEDFDKTEDDGSKIVITAADEILVAAGRHGSWIVRSSDAGETWSKPLNLFPNEEVSASFFELGADGSLFLGGTSYGDILKRDWVIKRSFDGGKTWISSIPVATPNNDAISALKVDHSGKIFATGVVNGFGIGQVWKTYFSMDQGSTWKVVDEDSPSVVDASSEPQGMALDPSGGAFVAGWKSQGQTTKWVVRKVDTTH